MFLLPQAKGKAYAVFGLGRTGLSAARCLMASGATVLAWDDSEAQRMLLKSQLGLAASDPNTWDWSKIEALVLSPGIPLTHPVPHPVVLAAQAAGVPVIGDMELMVQALGAKADRAAPIIAVTGTNGKSTTTALIGHILSRSGFSPQIGGNIGKPVLDLEMPTHNRVYVLEVSSYQMDLTPSLAPDVAVLLNLAPDHLNRHGDMTGYVASKRKIFDGQQPDDTAIIGIDDTHSSAIAAELKCAHVDMQGPKVSPLTMGRVLGKGIYALEGRMVDTTMDPAIEVTDISKLNTLRGTHNWQNACAAYAAARAVGAETGRIAQAIDSFPGLAHRQEFVGRQEHVIYVNDSKATNGDAAAMALRAYDNIYWIVGGEPKEGGLDATLSELSQLRKAYLIGRAATYFAKVLDGKTDFVIAETLEEATRQASADALTSGNEAVVLLSPACASFDQFKDFEARGDAFRETVKALIPQEIAEGAVQ